MKNTHPELFSLFQAKFPSSHLKTGASSVAPLGCFAVPLAVWFTLFYSSLASPRRASS